MLDDIILAVICILITQPKKMGLSLQEVIKGWVVR